jgi:two-component system CheB/CheR fusion protein
MAEKMLNLVPSDIDRSIGHINPNLEGANLEQLIADCIDTIALIEREVQDREGRWFSLRVRPYRSAENKIDGAVLALFDIDAPKRYEAAVRSALGLAETLLHEITEPAALLDSGLRLRAANADFLELFAIPPDGFRGRPLVDVALADGYDQLTAVAEGRRAPDGGLALTLRPAHVAAPLAARARTFAAPDGTLSGIVLLTVAR